MNAPGRSRTRINEASIRRGDTFVAILRSAPELATLALLDEILRVTHAALLAEHPTLRDPPSETETPSVLAARDLARIVVGHPFPTILDVARRA